jgi:uncharacterized membrane protein
MDKVFLDFISNEDEKRILEAIGRAERNTSGEIRVHLQKKRKGDVVKNAVETFNKLEMYRTRDRNAVLFYIDVDRRKFAVIGDRGINDKVPAGFWDDIVRILQKYFREKKYTDGLVEAILKTGEKLKVYFPYRANDVNELPDEISTD